jgi:hypothetical protein
LTLENEYGGDVTIPTQVIKYNQFFLQADQPIRLQYSRQIKLYTNVANISKYEIGTVVSVQSAPVPIGEFDSHKCARYNFVYYSLSEKCNRLGAGGGVGGLSTTVSSTIKTCHHVITEMLLTMAIHAHNPFNISMAIRNKYVSQN